MADSRNTTEPWTPPLGTYAEMLDAALSEIERLRARVADLERDKEEADWKAHYEALESGYE